MTAYVLNKVENIAAKRKILVFNKFSLFMIFSEFVCCRGVRKSLYKGKTQNVNVDDNTYPDLRTFQLFKIQKKIAMMRIVSPVEWVKRPPSVREVAGSIPCWVNSNTWNNRTGEINESCLKHANKNKTNLLCGHVLLVNSFP